MTELKDVQQLVVTLIAAHAIFSGESVLLDDGKKELAESEALTGLGHSVMVLPLLDANVIDQANAEAVVNVGVAVRVAISPEVATKNIYDLVTAVKQSVIGYDGGTVQNPNNRFKLAQNAMILDPSDAGLLAYNIFFEKKAVF